MKRPVVWLAQHTLIGVWAERAQGWLLLDPKPGRRWYWRFTIARWLDSFVVDRWHR